MWSYDMSYKLINFEHTESFTQRDTALCNHKIICWPPSSAWLKGTSEVVIREAQLLYITAAPNLINISHLATCMLK